ncbi:MAG: flagellar hook-basal body complex protein FliE [Planctomycetes bacterium]|nr:flagellar hook-basal body complex protein FliE [Planctomycetota bacterium]
MTSRIGDSTSAARTAIEAALKRHAAAVERAGSPPVEGAGSAQKSGFASSLADGLKQLDAGARESDRLIEDVVAGRVTDFHEVALRLKESELSFRFSMELRNKFVDAYREVMRMSV